MTIRAIRQYPRLESLKTLKDAEAYLRKLLAALQEEAVVVSTLYRVIMEGVQASDEFSLIEIVDALPAAGNAGRMVYLTTDNKVYKDNGTAWIVLVDPTEVSEHLGGVDDPLVDTAAIADAAIETAKIAAAAVEEAKLATDAVTAAKIKASAVTTVKLNAVSVTAAKIATGAVITAKLDALAVTAAKIAALTITAGKIAAGAIETDKLDALAVTTAKIAAGAVTADEITAGTITADEIHADTITAGNLVEGLKMYWYSGASTNARNNNAAEKTTASASYVKIKEIKINETTGVMNVRFGLLATEGGAKVAYGKMYKNGSPVGAEHSTSNLVTWEYFEDEVPACVADDLIQIYAKKTGVDEIARVKDMALRYDRAVSIVCGETLTAPLATVDQTIFSVTNQDP